MLDDAGICQSSQPCGPPHSAWILVLSNNCHIPLDEIASPMHFILFSSPYFPFKFFCRHDFPFFLAQNTGFRLNWSFHIQLLIHTFWQTSFFPPSAQLLFASPTIWIRHWAKIKLRQWHQLLLLRCLNGALMAIDLTKWTQITHQKRMRRVNGGVL